MGIKELKMGGWAKVLGRCSSLIFCVAVGRLGLSIQISIKYPRNEYLLY